MVRALHEQIQKESEVKTMIRTTMNMNDVNMNWNLNKRINFTSVNMDC